MSTVDVPRKLLMARRGSSASVVLKHLEQPSLDIHAGARLSLNGKLTNSIAVQVHNEEEALLFQARGAIDIFMKVCWYVLSGPLSPGLMNDLLGIQLHCFRLSLEFLSEPYLESLADRPLHFSPIDSLTVSDIVYQDKPEGIAFFLLSVTPLPKYLA